MTVTGTPRKFGGWLMLLVVGLALFAGGMALRIPAYFDPVPAVEAYYGERWVWLQAIFTISALVVVFGNFYLCLKLLTDFRWQTVRLTIAGLWLIFCARSMIMSLATGLVAGIDLVLVVRQTAGNLGLMTAFAAIWTVYLLRSKRVAETYPRA